MSNDITNITKVLGQIYRVVKNHVESRDDAHQPASLTQNGFYEASDKKRHDNFFAGKHTLTIYDGENLLNEIVKRENEIGTFSCSSTAKGVPISGIYSSGEYRIHDKSGYVDIYNSDGSRYYNRCNGGVWLGWVLDNPFHKENTITIYDGENLLNEIVAEGNGIGTFACSTTAKGVPIEGVYSSGDYRIHSGSGYVRLFSGSDAYYINRYYGNEWKGWKKVSTS